jgi:hypothetical protein
MSDTSRQRGQGRSEKFLSGYIEGFYGRLLTFEERLGIAERLHVIGSGYYLYAPKEDPYHRREWRAPYSAAWKRDFRQFVREARRKGVRVLPGMAPGLSYRYRNAQDFAALERKLLGFAALGCEEAVLLMDDIPVELPKADTGTFHSLGEAHALLLRRLQERLCRRGGLRRLWFCPTVYSDFFARDGVEGDAYLRDLAAGMPQGMPWMWTGPAIVSKSLAPREFAPAARLMGRRPVLWSGPRISILWPSP